MSNYVNDDIMDAAHDETINNANAIHICSGDPTTRAAVLSASLATVAANSGDFAKADGDTSGRKNTVAAKTGMSITASGTAAVQCVIDGTRLLLKADLSATQVLTSGGTVDTGAFDHEILDVAA